MKPIFRRGLTAAAIFLSAQTASAASLINGSFESGTFGSPSAQTKTLPIGSTDMTGWTVIGNLTSWIGPGNPWQLAASDGDYFLDLTDYRSNAPWGGVQQTIVTNPGWIYEVTFDLGSSSLYGATSEIAVSAAGMSQTYSANNTGETNLWERKLFSFTALSSSTVLSFQGVDGFNYIGLDNVALSTTSAAPIPLPASMALLGTGFAGLAGVSALRRRRSRAA